MGIHLYHMVTAGSVVCVHLFLLSLVLELEFSRASVWEEMKHVKSEREGANWILHLSLTPISNRLQLLG